MDKENNLKLPNMMNDGVYVSFKRTIKEYKMDALIESYGTVVSAFSGGADSTCMLYLLNVYCKEHGIKLIAAHVNHMIRGDDADSDEMFCRNFAEKYEIPIEVEKIDIPKLAGEKRLGIEECARLARYDFFDRLSEKYGAVIATAHNASDNAETVLFNILRGCGTHGICGILPIRDKKFIRPLINVNGDLIRNFCKEYDISYVYDKTNTDTDYTRNYIRHIIMPTMKKISPDPASAIEKMSGIVRRDDDFMMKTACEKLAGRNFITRSEIKELHEAVTSRMLVMLYNSSKVTNSTIEERHVNDIIALAESEKKECSISVPGNMRAVIEKEIVYFAKTEAHSEEKKEDFQYPRDGSVYKNDMYIVTISHGCHSEHIKLSNDEENIYKLSTLRSLRFDKIKNTLIIRNRIDGDSYRYGGIRHKVKKLFIDSKISGREKASIPIFCDEEGIFWIPGFALRDGIETADGEDAVVIRVYKKIN